MPRKASLANALTKGVLDPDLAERLDLGHYFSGLESGRNLLFAPQGGVKRRPGTAVAVAGGAAQRLRRRLAPVQLTAGMVTAANGGTPTALVDQDPATRFVTDAVGVEPFVAAAIDLGAATAIVAVDVMGYSCATGARSRALAVEYWDGAGWVGFAPDAAQARKGIASGITSETLTYEHMSVAATATREAAFEAPYAGRVVSYTITIEDGSAVTGGKFELLIDGDLVPGSELTFSGIRLAGSTQTATFAAGTADFVQSADLRVRVISGEAGSTTLDDLVKAEIAIESVPERRSRRWAERPGTVRTARQWRIVAYGGAGIGALTLSGLRFWRELAHVSPQRGFELSRSYDASYQVVVTDRNADLFRDGVWVGAAAVAVDGQQVPELATTQSEDVAFLYHEDVQTPRIMWQGADDEWDGAPFAYVNVPDLTPGMAYGGGQNEIQEVDLAGVDGPVVLWLGDQFTVPVTIGPALVADALAALTAFVPSGLSVALVAGTVRTLRIEFTGAAGARRWPLVSAVPVSGVVTAWPSTDIKQRGLDAKGPLIGERTGWPRCGTIVQDRHMIAGFRGAPLSWGLSRYGIANDFKDEASPMTADLAFFGKLNTDRLEIIHHVFVGRTLQLFTDCSEWSVESRVLDAMSPPHVELATGQGIRSSVQPVFGEGGTMFVRKGGRMLLDFIFDLGQNAYTAPPLSLLAPHLLTDVVAMGYRPARSTQEGNHLFLVNADGTLAFATILKTQEVVAFAPWDTPAGGFRGAFADVQQRVWLLVERTTAAGGADLFLERLDDEQPLDSAVTYAGPATATIAGLAHLDGREVWAYADRDLVGPLTVTGGAVTLPEAASSVIVGLHPVVRGRLTRIRERLNANMPFRPPGRIYELGLTLRDTGQLDVAVNGGPFRDALAWVDTARRLDVAAEPARSTAGGYPAPAVAAIDLDPHLPLLDRLFGGVLRMTNLRGISRHPTIEFAQRVPAPLHIQAIRYEVVTHG